MLTASGQQFKDWTAAYRLFQGDRMNLDQIFISIQKQLLGMVPASDNNIYAHMDDTLLRKRGKKIAGTSWLRDPLGPPFANNFIWGQRFIQIALSLFEDSGIVPSKAIPIDFHYCPPAKKPGKNSTEEEKTEYKLAQQKAKISAVGAERIKALRENLNKEGYAERPLLLSVDGSYTNETVIRKLPEKVTLIGRIRKDSKLNAIPSQQVKTAGRTRFYGEELPTPDQIRTSDEYPWQEVKAWAAGKIRTFNVKVVKNVRWRKAGDKDLQLIVIRPVSYRLTKNSKLLYRNPAYLICTDMELGIQTLLQAYLWRWQIEVCFRDQKTLIGCGQAQVRKQTQAEKVPAFITACYSMLQLAASKKKPESATELSDTKWYKAEKKVRETTGDIINRFRLETWADSVKINLTDFVKLEKMQRNGKFSENPILSSILYGRN